MNVIQSTEKSVSSEAFNSSDIHSLDSDYHIDFLNMSLFLVRGLQKARHTHTKVCVCSTKVCVTCLLQYQVHSHLSRRFFSGKRYFKHLKIDIKKKILSPVCYLIICESKKLSHNHLHHLVGKAYSEVNKYLHNETNVPFNGKKIDSNTEVP